jgi:hypothetical protein
VVYLQVAVQQFSRTNKEDLSMIEEAAHAPLAAWESFYVIVGSSGAALTGLQFVVMALIAESPLRSSSSREIDAFGTPVIVHFGAVLLIAAIKNLSVVAVAPGPDGTTNNYFKDYFRTYRRNGSVTISGRWELGEGDDNCVKCHKSGVLPIFPVDKSVSEDEKWIVEEVNRRFSSYSAPRFGGYLDASKFGPGLGSMRSTGDNRHASPTSVNCTSCHQPNNLGWLNWPMNSVLISSFVAQLVDDYFSIDTKRPGVLKAWLLGTKE